MKDHSAPPADQSETPAPPQPNGANPSSGPDEPSTRPGTPSDPRPSSARRIASSRANGALSQGPITSEGKARSSRNAAKHNLCAQSVVLPSEDEEAFESLRSALWAAFPPLNEAAELLLENMVVARWRQSRIWEFETATIADEFLQQDASSRPSVRSARAFRSLADTSTTLSLLDRYEIRYDRQFARALRLFLLINQPDPDNCETNPVPIPDTPLATESPVDLPNPSDPIPSRDREGAVCQAPESHAQFLGAHAGPGFHPKSPALEPSHRNPRGFLHRMSPWDSQRLSALRVRLAARYLLSAPPPARSGPAAPNGSAAAGSCGAAAGPRVAAGAIAPPPNPANRFPVQQSKGTAGWS